MTHLSFVNQLPQERAISAFLKLALSLSFETTMSVKFNIIVYNLA